MMWLPEKFEIPYVAHILPHVILALGNVVLDRPYRQFLS